MIQEKLKILKSCRANISDMNVEHRMAVDDLAKKAVKPQEGDTRTFMRCDSTGSHQGVVSTKFTKGVWVYTEPNEISGEDRVVAVNGKG